MNGPALWLSPLTEAELRTVNVSGRVPMWATYRTDSGGEGAYLGLGFWLPALVTPHWRRAERRGRHDADALVAEDHVIRPHDCERREVPSRRCDRRHYGQDRQGFRRLPDAIHHR